MKLDTRLETAASFVREGAVFADIGTDHAYLPIALLLRGQIRCAIAADIASGPLQTAMEHIASCERDGVSLSDRIRLMQTDGLIGLDTAEPAVTDIAVCGMGGELIAEIVAQASFVRNREIRLILQPMTMQAHLRRSLAEMGFFVETERLCKTANDKIYSVICCHYAPENVHTPTETEEILGRELLRDAQDFVLRSEYLHQKKQSYLRIIEGKRSAGHSCDVEKRILAEIESHLSKDGMPL